MTRGTVQQVAYVTNDLDAAVRQYTTLLGGPRWTFAHIDGIKDLTYRGKPAQFTFDQAPAQFAGMQMEFIQPVSGDKIYTEALQDAPPPRSVSTTSASTCSNSLNTGQSGMSS
jgi:hypothetical protein